ncbi:MAG: dipeptide epimerase [Bacteroidetes bacterium]|nr:dipeptide epimerase [Bacteroidota bacterium]
MKIESIDFASVKMPLKEPYDIAYETVSEIENIFIRIQLDNGIVGYGSTAPDLEVTGETPGQVLEDVEEIIKPILMNEDPLRYSFHLSKLKDILTNKPSTLALADTVLFDLLGKICRQPVYKIFGAFKKKMATSVTIGILPMEETILRAKYYLGEGFRILKIKGGKDVQEDIRKINRIRKEVGNNIKLRFDANQGYTINETFMFFEGVKESNVEILEQPTPRNQPDSLGKFTENLGILIMADESLLTLRDVFSLVQKKLVDTVNIKLMKVGGIQEALHINSVAKSANVHCMIGCMDESALSIAAGLHFALAKPNVIYADLDGHIDLLNDPAAGAVRLKNGFIYPTGGNGLGFDLPDKIFN